MTTSCSACNHENRDEARFCSACGTPLTISCPACGTVAPPDAGFCDACGANLKESRQATEGKAIQNETETGEVAGTAAERRHLTVLFCDLVGSASLSEKMDPEDFRDLLAAYQDTCAVVVNHYDGVVARYVGDGLLIYFGYPHAHEDDAPRAVRAGLEIVEAVGKIDLDLALSVNSLHVRIGIATGTVVVGDIGTGARREEMAVVGETPNLAARLQGLADPGEVIIAEETHKLVEGYFDIDDLGDHDLKGISISQKVYRVRQESGALDRLEASARTGLTQLVGRQEEIAILSNRWLKARQGESQLITVSGEAGIGKSRVVRAFRESIVNEPHARVLYYGSPYHQNSAFHPVIDQFERALRFDSNDSIEKRLDKLVSEVTRLGLEVESIVPPVAAMLSLELKDQNFDLPEPGDIKRRQLVSMIAILEAMSAENPVLIVAEDVHWYDPSSLEMLVAIKQNLDESRILMVMTHRPDFSPALAGVANLTQIPLSHLGGLESTVIVTQVSGNKPLPDEVATEIIAKADGIPLFVEELTKSLLESGVLRDDGKRYVLDEPLPPLAIPPSLQDSLMARLDRLATTKEIAQLASCIGRNFDFSLLSAVSTFDETELRNALKQLVEAELIYERGMRPDIKFEFKHALVRDAAYESLLKSTRQLNHQRIAQALENNFVALAETQPELVAQHYTEAGLIEPAVAWWYRAGQRATRIDANLEAIQHLEQGLELAEQLERSEGHIRLEADMLLALGNTVRLIEGYASERAGKLFARSRSLYQQISDKNGEFPALWGLSHMALANGSIDKAEQYAREVLALAEEIGNPDLELEAHHTLWGAYYLMGDLKALKYHSEKGIELYRFEEHGEYGFTYGNHDPGACATYSNAHALWLLGYREQARARLEDAIELIMRHSQPQFISHGLMHCCITYMLLGEVDVVREVNARAYPIAIETANLDLSNQCEFIFGWIRAQEGGYADGADRMKNALADRRAGASSYYRGFFLSALTNALYRNGLYQEGQRCLRQAHEIADESCEHWWSAELHRLDGKAYISMDDGDPQRARERFQKALDISRKQESKILELRAASDMSRLMRDQGDPKQAFELLAPVYEWFTEGLEADDLRDAKTLLDELS
ncbi:MAG: adenylate/guanylate cyclase domain-containing protein [Gammaproteobacteria bacterium]|nr:MAG: adenylate/guanylate cyclase domain-containing protein [Gammaproteobacteria bacterium]